jgi:hypothetical protein
LAKPDAGLFDGKTGVDAQLDKSLLYTTLEILGLKSSTEPSPAVEQSSKVPELKIPEPSRSKEYDFDIDM